MVTLATLDLTLEWTRTAAIGILGYGLLAGLAATGLAFGYRARTTRRLVRGPVVLAGLAVPLTWLTLKLWRRGVIVADSPLSHHTTGIYLLGVVAMGSILATGGYRLGDHLACDVFGISRLAASGPAADRIRSAGLAVVLSLPETVDDADGYLPVSGAVKRRLEGREMLLARHLSPDERRERLRRRLKDDFGIDYVDLEFGADGTVETLAVGRQSSGLGATLPPGRSAVAIRTACPPLVSAGDPVEVWTTNADSSHLVATGTFRASSGTVATLVVDEDDSTVFTSETAYQLTIRSDFPSNASDLVSAIRTADETVVTTTVVSDGPLESEFVGWVPGTVVVIERGDEIMTRPADNETVHAGDRLYVLGTPETLRELP
ncbi:hypothetical protein C495_00665 [Natronorubrum sulfidifaciens JCM 14089]|uniref:RCK C-terminal domain-containing protein n=1 Tax=Natronorubrum sulfidifaciens JCM 14089 TaxID=1230460 RepID=L9WJ68_9EURY|nr:hypothetical protein C495_00665 [Natronorubrum sulfidifaciens JCM 14089]